jgi:hypothetical protein
MPRVTLVKSSPRRTPGSRRLIKLDSGIRRNDKQSTNLRGIALCAHGDIALPGEICHAN